MAARHAASRLFQEVVHFALRVVLFVAVVMAELTDELIPLSTDGLEVVVRQLAPLRLGLAFDLLPVCLHVVPVHLGLLRAVVLPVVDRCSRHSWQSSPSSRRSLRRRSAT